MPKRNNAFLEQAVAAAMDVELEPVSTRSAARARRHEKVRSAALSAAITVHVDIEGHELRASTESRGETPVDEGPEDPLGYNAARAGVAWDPDFMFPTTHQPLSDLDQRLSDRIVAATAREAANFC